MGNRFPWLVNAAIAPITSIRRDEINLPFAHREWQAVAGDVEILPFHGDDDRPRPGRRSQLKRDLCVRPYRVIRRRASADCDGGMSSLRAKAFAPDRDPDAAILLRTHIRPALKVREKDARRRVRHRVLPR